MSEGGLDVILYLFLFLCIGVLCRQFVVGRGISMPVHFFMFLAGMFIGALSLAFSYNVDPLHLETVSPETPFNIYMCILMLDCAFNTEVNYLRVIMYHMVVIVIPTLVVLYILIALAGVWLFPYNMQVRHYMVLVSVIAPPGPHMMRAFLAPTNVHQDLKTLMEAESMFGNYITFMVMKVLTTNQTYTTGFAYVFLDLLVGIILGFAIGKLTIFWISRIFKDFVNQTTIILAFSFAGFALSYLMTSKGFLCVVTIGLVLSHRKASMSTQFVQILNTVMELLIFCLTTLTCVSVGVYFVTIALEHIILNDILVTIAIFVIQSAGRALVLFVAYQFSSEHLQSKTNTAIMWACNIRGSYSLMMCYSLLGYTHQKGTLSKVFILVLMQILLSFGTNSLICSYVIGYLNEETLSKKKWMIERAARLMIAIRNSAVESLRNVANIADADWNVVVAQTKLRSEFLTAYRYSRWLSNRTEVPDDKKTDPALEMKLEAIRQINLSEKACYTKLYSQGLLSRQSVLSLKYLVNICLKMKRLLEPRDIFKTESSTSFFAKLEQELAVTIQKGPPSVFIRLFVFTFCLLDSFSIAHAIFFLLFDDLISIRLLVITAHNVVMFLGYLTVVIYFMIKNKSIWSTNLWQTLYKIVILVTFIDLVITASPIVLIQLNSERSSAYEVVNSVAGPHYKKVFKITVIFCIFTRILRSLPVIQILPIFQLYLLNFVTHMQDKELFTEFDMATGYMRVITETLSKMNSIVTDRQMAMNLRYQCHKNKLETSQHLSLTQLQHPNVIAALKTRDALRLTLNAQEHSLLELKEMGVVGEMDSDLIHKDILSKMAAVQNFPYIINPSNMRTLLLGIPWIEEDLSLLHKIENVGHVVKFYSNDIILSQGYLPHGIFIILEGVVRVESLRPTASEWKDGKVPYYVTYRRASTASFSGKTELHGFYTRGNIIGEMAFLNETPGHKTYRCATYVETYFVPSIDLADIFKRSPVKAAPLSPLELRMWRSVAIRQAVRIIHKGAGGFNLPRLAIFNQMAESYIVDGNASQILAVQPNEVCAVILIHGYVSQFYTDVRYVGPCILPYNQQKFISHPELGARVVYLIMKNMLMEDNTLEGLLPEDPKKENYEDTFTISSGSSDTEPYRREKDNLMDLQDESDFMERMFTSGMSDKRIKDVKKYHVRKAASVTM